ncbi:hypothetical protein [Halomarina rubra]|uniref:Uncharacterized protein n=1 Tax=Halomarina rubra TaxID=2071873 RepID=A0ABD6AW23_9EURY|nr:hypothetical protein [Halomarina rubra]
MGRTLDVSVALGNGDGRTAYERRVVVPETVLAPVWPALVALLCASVVVTALAVLPPLALAVVGYALLVTLPATLSLALVRLFDDR